MPYVKLDCGILDSTLWIDRDQREVFLTALLMAQPVEFATELEQLRVETIEPTGFKAPPGWYGMVEAAGPGIVRRALVDPEKGMFALHALGEPDPQSRSQKHDGRRLIRVDGGFLVLNFMDYRDRDYTMADRARRYRERKKAASNGSGVTSRREHVTSHRDITQSESESESKTESNPKKLKATRKSPRELPDWFIEFKSIFPRRAGDPDWAGGLRAANARIGEGHNPREFTEGARRYAAYIEATKRGGTDFIQQASRFLGSGKPFSLPWNAPAEAESDWDQMMRLNGGKDNGPGRVFENTEPSGTALEASVRLVRS